MSPERETIGLRLAWLQQTNGTAIDPEFALITVGGSRFGFPFGSREIQLVWEMMDAGISSTAGYPGRTAVDSLTTIRPASNSSMNPLRRYDLVLQELTLVLQATKAGRLRWQKSPAPNDPRGECYSAAWDNRDMHVEFYAPLIGVEAVLPRAIAKVYFASLHGCDFACGTEGYYLVEEILAAAFPAWKKRLDKETAALTEEIDALQKLIEDDPGA